HLGIGRGRRRRGESRREPTAYRRHRRFDADFGDRTRATGERDCGGEGEYGSFHDGSCGLAAAAMMPVSLAADLLFISLRMTPAWRVFSFMRMLAASMGSTAESRS